VNRRLAFRYGKQFDAETIAATGKRWMMIGAVALASIVPLVAQSAELQQKLAAVKQSVAENKQRLQQYQWMETTQLTLKGEAKPSSQTMCQ
jgi:hypothetical protein